MDVRQCLIWSIIFYLLMLGITGCALTPEQSSRDKFRISKEELKDRLNDPSLIILDVRISKDWNKSGKKSKEQSRKILINSPNGLHSIRKQRRSYYTVHDQMSKQVPGWRVK